MHFHYIFEIKKNFLSLDNEQHARKKFVTIELNFETF